MKNQHVHISQKKRIRSFSVDKNELRKLLEILQERAYAAAELEEKHLIRLDDQTDEEFEQTKTDLNEGFKLFIYHTIQRWTRTQGNAICTTINGKRK